MTAEERRELRRRIDEARRAAVPEPPGAAVIPAFDERGRPVIAEHGSAAAYGRWRCRCKQCKAASAAGRRARRAANPEADRAAGARARAKRKQKAAAG